MSTITEDFKIPNRPFGIEIECFGTTRETVCEALRNAGISAEIERYNHDRRDFWKLTTDSTVPEGFEVVSPPLQGQAGIDLIEKVSKILIANKARIDKRCGLHVHVDVSDVNSLWMLNIAKRYKNDEKSTIDNWMPKSRRASSNKYCDSMDVFFKRFKMDNVGPNTHIREMLKLCNTRDEDRRFKVNLLAFLRHGTVEFRQHGGTVDHKKIIPWVLFCLNFVETSKVEVTTEKLELTQEEEKKQKIDQKYRLLAETLDQFEGFGNPISHNKLAEILNIPIPEVEQYISRFRTRFDLKVEVKPGSGAGYYKPAFANDDIYKQVVEKIIPAIPYKLVYPFPQDKGPVFGLPPQIISYFEEKVGEMNGAEE